jgi:hypothetical protein
VGRLREFLDGAQPCPREIAMLLGAGRVCSGRTQSGARGEMACIGAHGRAGLNAACQQRTKSRFATPASGASNRAIATSSFGAMLQCTALPRASPTRRSPA